MTVGLIRVVAASVGAMLTVKTRYPLGGVGQHLEGLGDHPVPPLASVPLYVTRSVQRVSCSRRKSGRSRGCWSSGCRVCRSPRSRP